MMLIVCRNIETGKVEYAVTDVRLIRHITPSEIGFTGKDDRIRSMPFLHTERVEVEHIR
jgi:hypothetical protein